MLGLLDAKFFLVFQPLSGGIWIMTLMIGVAIWWRSLAILAKPSVKVESQ